MLTGHVARRLRLAVALVALVVASVVVVLGDSAPAAALPPNIPSAATAQSQLDGLTVRSEGSMSGYSRDLFPHWSTVSGACNTRETVLDRDGTNVVVNSSCYPTSGSWFSPYDGITETAASDIDIDHVVPLAEAWRSGAASWSTARREDFANSLDTPQLIAVTDNSNSAKSDSDPAAWRPTRTSFHCTYARMWIGTKSQWSLTLQAAEKTALQSMLNTC